MPERFVHAEDGEITLLHMIQEVELGVQDCLGDNPDVAEEDVFRDIAWSIGHQYPPEVRDEFWLCNFGRRYPASG